MNNMEGAFAKNAVKGLASGNPLPPRRGMLQGRKAKKEKPAKPAKVKSERITTPPINVTSERIPKEEPQQSGPINVKSERINVPQEAIGRGSRELPAPPTKKASKPKKPRDVKYTQPTLPGMRNTRQFKGKSGKV
jgi:hypothetical protein